MSYIKKLLLILLISPACTYSQDCSKSIKTETDRFTDKKTVSLIYPLVKNNKRGLEFLMDLNVSEGEQILAMTVKSPSIGCIDQYAFIYFLFTDGTKESVRNDNEYNCKGIVLIFINKYFTENKILIPLFTEKTLKAIRVTGTSSDYEYEVPAMQADKFKKGANCILL